uniref:Ionotropic glutamate receptor C-terminal domain-containing protein n=1 Tax=Tetranychus urticae TaxID=32264 RepID=T1L3Q6_TETUR
MAFYQRLTVKDEMIGKEFKDLPEMYSRYTKSRIKLKLVKEGLWGVWKEGVGYTNGMLGAVQNCEANKPFFPVSLDTRDPPGAYTAAIEADTYHLTSYRLYDVIFKAIQAHLTGQIHGSPKTFLLLAFACLLTALFGAIINASFNTSAIVRLNNEKVKSLSDIIKINKSPLFFDGLSQYELFEAGVTSEFKKVYQYAVKKGSGKPKILTPNALRQLSRDLCFNVVALTSSRAAEFMKIYLEHLCSIKLGTPQYVFVSDPYHSTIKMTLFNPCTDGVVAEEMIRRDKAFYSVLLETGIDLQRTKLIRSYTIKSTLSLLGSKTKRKTDDSDLYSFSASPLKLSNFKGSFILQFFAAIIALFIEFGNHIYHRYVKLNLN